jgi:hypothetical protein
VFGGSKSVFLDVGDQVFKLVDEEGDHADEACDSDGDEAETGFAEVEVVNWGVDEREDLEEGVVDSVSEGGLVVC